MFIELTTNDKLELRKFTKVLVAIDSINLIGELGENDMGLYSFVSIKNRGKFYIVEKYEEIFSKLNTYVEIAVV